MERNYDLMTAEYASAVEPDKLLGAVYVPRKSAEEGARMIGRAVCAALGLDTVALRLYDSAGNLTAQHLIGRKR